MTNEEKYKSPEERIDAYKTMCSMHSSCEGCKFKEGNRVLTGGCAFIWLADECEEPDMPFRVVEEDGYRFTIRGVNPNELVHSGFGENPESIRKLCDAMNLVALAWHKRLSKEGV